MPIIPGDIPLGVLTLGLTQQNYQLLMGFAGLLCGFVVMLIWSRGL